MASPASEPKSAAAPKPLLTDRQVNRYFVVGGVITILCLGALIFFRPQAWLRLTPRTPFNTSHSPELPKPKLLPSGEPGTIAQIQFFTARVERDPEDCRSQNALSGLYLRRLQETGREDYLLPALTAARVSLETVGAERNLGALIALSHAEFSNHNFAVARDHALHWVALKPADTQVYAILGDAWLELGDYSQAKEAFQHMQQLGPNTAETEIRLARLSILAGDTEQAWNHFARALVRLLDQQDPPRETAAWCRWQLGETAFSVGDLKSAERQYRDALVTAPDYFRALASLGRLRAARGDLPEAINYYEQAVRIDPAPEFMAALGDLYQLSGHRKEAGVRYALVEQLAEHSRKVHGQPYNRQLALFYADHDMNAEQAYKLAKSEYALRKDIYGADALAWTAMKFGRLAEAEAASDEALRLGTRDAKMLYHAGMIASALGKVSTAADYIKRALELNPTFDPLQSSIARTTLKPKQHASD